MLAAMLTVLATTVSADEVRLFHCFDGMQTGLASRAWVPLTRGWDAWDGGYGFTDHRRTGTLSWRRGRAFADVDVSVRFHIADEGGGVRAPGIVVRSQDSLTHYYVHYDSKHSQVIIVRSEPAKTWNELKRVPGVPITSGEWHTARVTCIGTHIAAYLDGKVVAEADDATLDSGIVALRAGQGRILFDNLEVRGAEVDLTKEWVLLPESKPNDDLDRPMLEKAERVAAVRGGGYFPVLIKLQDGSLGAVVRGGAPHIGIKGRMDWIRSTDGGKTWSEPAVVVDSKWDDRNPALGQMADGTVVMSYAEAQTYNEAGEWDTSAGEYIQFYVTSKDNGGTWSEKKKLYTGAIRGGSPFGRTILLSDGTAFMPMYGHRDPDWKGAPTEEEVAGTTISAYVVSRDNGETWGEYTVVAPTGHNEISLLALTDERLIAMCRTVGGAVNQFDSRDGGKTWEGPKNVTQASQHPPDLVELASGRLLLVWGNRRAPLGIGCAVSDDRGETWRYDDRVMVAWTSNNGDSGYPSLVQLDDGTIVMLYYAVGTSDFGDEELCLGVRFEEGDLMEAMEAD